MALFLFTLTSPHSHSESAADSETRKEADKLTSSRGHSSRCVAYAVAGEEANESSCKAVALCADVEITQHEGAKAVVEEAMLEMAEVNVVVVRLPC